MQTLTPLVSVLMSCYKERADYLEAAIDSILKQTFTNFEYIIILDNPENILLKEILEKYAEMDKRIKVYINEKNIGLPLSLNRGISYCKGKYIARMDADDIAEPDRLSEELSFITEQNYDLIGTWITTFNIDGPKTLITSPATSIECNRFLKKGDCLAHPTWFGKREVYKELNGYRNILACEDYDFLLRASIEGFKLGNVQKSLLNYRLNENGISQTNFYQQQIMTIYLSKAYRKNNSPTFEEIQKFVISKKYKYYADIYINLRNYSTAESLLEKIYFLIKIGCTWYGFNQLRIILFHKICHKVSLKLKKVYNFLV